MKQKLIFLALAFALAVPLAACSPNVPETPTHTPAVSAAPKPTSTPGGIIDDIGNAGKDVVDDIGNAAKNITNDVKRDVKNAVR